MLLTPEQKNRLFNFLWPYINRGSSKDKHTEKSIWEFIDSVSLPEPATSNKIPG